MIITYYGKAFTKAQLGETVIAFNPISRESDKNVSRFGADAALISLNHPDFNGAETVAYANKSPFVIDGPGEYEVGGIFIQGFSSEGASGRINKIYTLELDNIRLCHLGGLAHPTLNPDVIEEMGVIDILFVPIGGETLSPKDAAKLASSLEPKLIIPLLCEDGKGSEETLKTFLKEAGGGKETVTDKLSLKKKDLEGKEGEVVVLKV